MRFALPLALAFAAAPAAAQSTIYGLDVRQGNFFTSNTSGFVSNFTNIATNLDPVFALDFTADGTTLWGVNNTTLDYGTFDLLTGVFNVVGTLVGPTSASGLTCTVGGSVWYLMEFNATLNRSFLWVGDVTTGSFTQVGFSASGILIDIAIDTGNNLYGHSITNDSLYRIDTATGAGTLLGPTGLTAGFAQGMDFDWTTNTLYAAIYTTGGAGNFCTMNLVTGQATVLEDTTPLNGEFEFAVQTVPGSVGSAYCFGDGSGSPCPCGNDSAPGAMQGCANSTGQGAVLGAVGSASVGSDDIVFTSTNLLPGQPALLFTGLNATGMGNGLLFGDGLRCAGGSVSRLGIRVPNAQGEATWGPGLAATGGWGAGDTRRFQSWYRNPTGSPCGSNFNLSHGYEVTFTP